MILYNHKEQNKRRNTKMKNIAEILNELEKRAREIEKNETFKGDSKAIAEILLAGMQMMAEESENK